eukprot:scaffold16371_cov60-Phaeocystis_antarctica.AAC.4
MKSRRLHIEPKAVADTQGVTKSFHLEAPSLALRASRPPPPAESSPLARTPRPWPPCQTSSSRVPYYGCRTPPRAPQRSPLSYRCSPRTRHC